jgi:membrane-bound inhibitor of C-type lysozyme
MKNVRTAAADTMRVTLDRRGRRGIAAVLLAATLTGCVGVALQEPYNPQGRYVCENGKEFVFQYAPDGASALVTYETQWITLPATGAGAADAKFTDGRNTLYLDGPRALLNLGGQIVGTGCVKR